MKKVVHRSDTRGRSVYDWLDSHHSFSFDEYYNPERVHFGALRVLNDDRVAPGEGFQTHPHKNMEIVSIPLKGLLAHGDSKKNSRTITVGDIQVMRAGTGIYQDYDIRGLLKKDELAFILSPDGSTPAKLLQDTWFSMGEIGAGKTVEYTLHGTDMGVYVFLIEGEVKIDDVILTRRDGLGISEIKNFEIETLKDSKILLIEVPM